MPPGLGIRVPIQVRIGSFGYRIFWIWKLGHVRVLQNFGSGSNRVLSDPGGFGSDVKEPKNNRIINVSETGLDNSTQSNHITRFDSDILYPNYPNVPKNNQKYSLDTVLFEYFYLNYHILSENTQKY